MDKHFYFKARSTVAPPVLLPARRRTAPLFKAIFGLGQKPAAKTQAKVRLLKVIEETERGLRTSREQLREILDDVQVLAEPNACTNDSKSSATWRLLFTTEKVVSGRQTSSNPAEL